MLLLRRLSSASITGGNVFWLDCLEVEDMLINTANTATSAGTTTSATWISTSMPNGATLTRLSRPMLSSGTIAGFVVGFVATVALLVVIGFLPSSLLRKRARKVRMYWVGGFGGTPMLYGLTGTQVE